MQHKITTHKGDTLLLIEVPNNHLLHQKVKDNILSWWNTNISDAEHKKFDSDFEIVGKLSTLTDKNVEPFVEEVKALESNIGIMCFVNYEDNERYFTSSSESFNSLLQHNNIDLNKEWVVLKQLNNE